MPEIADSADILKVGIDSGDAGIAAGVEKKEVLDFCGRLVGDNDVNLSVVLLKVMLLFEKKISKYKVM